MIFQKSFKYVMLVKKHFYLLLMLKSVCCFVETIMHFFSFLNKKFTFDKFIVSLLNK